MSPALSRRRARLFWCAIVLLTIAGCGRNAGQPELLWGKRGRMGGDLVKPRAVAIDGQDRLYVVDWTARIQVFDRDGKFLGREWTTPDFSNGRPSGLSVDHDGNLVVSDSHYHCVRIYSPEGEQLRVLGGKGGSGEGELSYVSDAVRDAEGNFYVSEFGDNQRISKFDAAGKFVKCWGAPGSEPGQFARIRAMALGPDGNLYCADACNHRIQVFTRDGQLVRIFGAPGDGPGEFSYPYDIAISSDREPRVYVVEYGNARVQKFTLAGEPLGVWGGPGRGPGQLASPWALAVDSRGRVHVLDSDNDRVQRIDF